MAGFERARARAMHVWFRFARPMTLGVRAVVVIALTGFVAACPASTPSIDRSESEGEDNGEDDPYLAATSYCEELATVFCPFYLRCGRLDGVDDIDAAADALRAAGVRMLYDTAKRGTAGSKVNFCHPKDCGGVLVELVQANPDAEH